MNEDEQVRYELARTETDRMRLEFIETEISTGTTFTDLARTEYALGNREHAEKVRGDAEKAYTTAAQWLAEATEKLDAAQLAIQLGGFRKMLDALPGGGKQT